MYDILYKDGVEATVAVPVAPATAIEVGELVKLDTGEIIPVVDSTDNLDFEGVAKGAKRDIDTRVDKIVVSRPNATAVFEAPLDEATDITYGDLLQINNSKSLKKSATDPVAKAVETKLGATSVRVVFLRKASDTGDAA